MIGKSELTQKTYAADLEAFGRFVGFQRADPGLGRLLEGGAQYAYGIILDYIEALKEQGLQAVSVNKKLAPIRSVLKLARYTGLVEWEIKVPNLKTQPYRDVSGPSHERLTAVLRDLESQPGARPARDRALILLIATTGLRNSAVRNLDLVDLKEDDKGFGVWAKEKGRPQKEWKAIPLGVASVIQNWLGYRGAQDGPLFTALDHNKQGSVRLPASSFTSLTKKKYGFTPHQLRHYAVNRAIEVSQSLGINYHEICQLTGHKHLSTLQIYIDKRRDVAGILSEAIFDNIRTAAVG
jgi:integrase